MQKVIIIGKGGHAKVIADIVMFCGDELVGFIDDNFIEGEMIFGKPVLGTISDYRNYLDCQFIIGIGSIKDREMISH